MTSNEPIDSHEADPARWWKFWRWSWRPYSGRRDRLSPEAQGDAANYGMRGGH
jgi:hypothetical protein